MVKLKHSFDGYDQAYLLQMDTYVGQCMELEVQIVRSYWQSLDL